MEVQSDSGVFSSLLIECCAQTINIVQNDTAYCILSLFVS